MSRFDGLTTTELFNVFHDDYKDFMESHWAVIFRLLSGVTKEQIDACYFYNIEIPNDEKANKKLVDFLDELDHQLSCNKDKYEDILNNAKDLFEIYINEFGQKWIRVFGYYYDEGEDNGEGTSRSVYYSEFELPVEEFIDERFDYDAYTESLEQYIEDMTYDEACECIKEYVNKNNVKELDYKDVNKDTKCGFYVGN